MLKSNLTVCLFVFSRLRKQYIIVYIGQRSSNTGNDLLTTKLHSPFWNCSTLVSHNTFWGEQGWCSGESSLLPPMWPGVDEWMNELYLSVGVFKCRFLDPASHVVWVCCCVSSLLRVFFSGFSGFPLTKINTSKFEFHLETVDEQQISIYFCFFILFG